MQFHKCKIICWSSSFIFPTKLDKRIECTRDKDYYLFRVASLASIFSCCSWTLWTLVRIFERSSCLILLSSGREFDTYIQNNNSINLNLECQTVSFPLSDSFLSFFYMDNILPFSLYFRAGHLARVGSADAGIQPVHLAPASLSRCQCASPCETHLLV